MRYLAALGGTVTALLTGGRWAAAVAVACLLVFSGLYVWTIRSQDRTDRLVHLRKGIPYEDADEDSKDQKDSLSG